MRPVRIAGWVWLQAVIQQKKAARAECKCAGAAHKHFSLVLCCGGFLVPVFLLPRQTILKKRIPLVVLHAIAIVPRLLEAGGSYFLFSEAEGKFGLHGAVVGPSEAQICFSNICWYRKLGSGVELFKLASVAGTSDLAKDMAA